MNYDEFHNHKWARSLKHARGLLAQNRLAEFYNGEDLADGDVYPGMRVMAAYWVSVEHEMKLRRKTLLAGAGVPEWAKDPELLAQVETFFERYLEDMAALLEREGIAPPERLGELAARGWETPAGWAANMQTWQEQSRAAVEGGAFDPGLIETWFNSCLRSLANYNRHLIWGGVNAAALVRRRGVEAFRAAVDATAEPFMWEISREFFVNVLPAAGFEDIGDLMELGMRGMYADQWFHRGEERQEEGEKIIRQSILENCELAGIYFRTAAWNGLAPTATGYGICRYCETHGLATMMITMPPMVSPSYVRLQSQGMDAKECIFELTTVPADDMERILMVQEKVFGEV